MIVKRKILFVTNMHFNKNGNGGQQRTYYLIKELSRHRELLVLSPYNGQEHEVKGISADFIINDGVACKKEFSKNKISGFVLKILNLLITFVCPQYSKTVHMAPFAAWRLSNQLKTVSKQSKFDNLNTIVFDTLSTVVPIHQKAFKNRILNAHNFDYELAQASLESKIKKRESNKKLNATTKHIELLKKYECKIDKYFTEIWVCSKDDETKFRKFNHGTSVEFYILPNGSDPQARPLQSFHNTYHKFLFVGSLNYEPNYNGLKWFVDKIFKRLDNHYHLDIVGRSPNPKHFEYVNEHPGINLIGEVDDLESVYQKYDVMVVPLLEGSGTRLKILEAMSYGKLVLSTAKGIEGIDAVNNEHYLEFNTLEDFKSILNKLENSEEVKIIRTNGRNLIENSYSWCGIVKKYLSVKKV